MEIPTDHPRKESLEARQKLVKAYKKGIVAEEGLIAHGRGEAFDYLLGEKTVSQAAEAMRVACKEISKSQTPVLSVNGNTAALVPREIAMLSQLTSIQVEVNLFHHSQKRVRLIINHLENFGAEGVLGMGRDSRIEGLSHDRGMVCREGIYSADTVIVPLEDGDRTEKLKEIGKKVISIDLNPLSRTSRMADISIVDNIMRCLPIIVEILEKENRERCCKIKNHDLPESFDNKENLKVIEEKMRSGIFEDK